MYQQKIDADPTSLEGMEEVFHHKETPPSASVAQAALPQGTTKPTQVKANEWPLTREKRILRGTYSKGMLILKEEVLGTAARDVTFVAGQSSQAINVLRAGKERLSENAFQSEVQNTILPSPGSVSDADSLLLELIKTHAEQAKTANELIKHLTEQLEEQKKYIQQLLSGRPKFGFLSRLWQKVVRR